MMTNIPLWWHERSGRERGLLTGLGFIILLVVAWIIVAALAKAKSHEEMRVVRALDIHKTVLAYAGGTMVETPVTLSAERIIALADGDGLGARIGGGTGDAVEIDIDAVRADILFTWISRLEREERLIVTAARIGRNEDSTLSASLTLAATP